MESSLNSFILLHGSHCRVLDRLTSINYQLIYDEDDDGNTPLHLAARQGWNNTVELLLKRKANIDAKYITLCIKLSIFKYRLDCKILFV